MKDTIFGKVVAFVVGFEIGVISSILLIPAFVIAGLLTVVQLVFRELGKGFKRIGSMFKKKKRVPQIYEGKCVEV